MVDQALARPPQVDARPWLQRLPSAARFIFRGDAAAQSAAGTVFGVTFSTVACRAVTAGARAALWLGPDEQLLIAPAADAPAIPAQFAAALSAVPHSLVDTGHRQVALELHGAQAAWLLNGACPLDLDPSAFPVGMCTRTVFGKAEIVLWRTATDGFHVEVWRSFTRYVTGLLDEIARELPD
ncbi:MAG: sarcosine oxidase subunit gamma family protein [Steroidobacteraceae bacterium]